MGRDQNWRCSSRMFQTMHSVGSVSYQWKLIDKFQLCADYSRPGDGSEGSWHAATQEAQRVSYLSIGISSHHSQIPIGSWGQTSRCTRTVAYLWRQCRLILWYWCSVSFTNWQVSSNPATSMWDRLFTQSTNLLYSEPFTLLEIWFECIWIIGDNRN